jgi:CBS domain containing-hemolysin-like protein
MTFDLLHHLVLTGTAAIVFAMEAASGTPYPFLAGVLVIAAAVVLVQTGARMLALSDPERALRVTLPFITLLYYLMTPLVRPVTWTIMRFRAMGRARRAASASEEEVEEEIEAFIDAGRQEGILQADEGRLIRQVVEFHDAVVREAMTPRTELIAIPIGSTLAHARELFAREKHSRLPVYRDQLDNIEGIIALKELVARWGELPEDAPIQEIMRPAYFVPETKPVSELLKELQSRRLQLAVVVDEYGGTAGVVTIEDLLEQLVGEIQEEHEHEERPVVPQSDGTFVAQGSASVEDLESALGVEVPAKGFDTIAGLVYSALGRIPDIGETVDVSGLRLEVLKADTRRIERVRISRLAQSASP